MQVATSSTLPSANDVIDLWWILHNKPGIVATFFYQRTTEFELVFIVCTFTTCSSQISCFRKTKAKTKCTFASRLIWQLVIHSCFIFAYKISRRTGENQETDSGVKHFLCVFDVSFVVNIHFQVTRGIFLGVPLDLLLFCYLDSHRNPAMSRSGSLYITVHWNSETLLCLWRWLCRA